MFDVIPITSLNERDCGPTCLQMLLAYYGTDVDLDTLCSECGVDVLGCTGADLLRVGRAHGLDMLAFQMDVAELIRQDRPAIVWWKRGHFCMMCGRNAAGQVVICNPDRGRYPLDAGTFAALYSGVALFNGNPVDLPEPEPDPDASDLAEAARILLGVSE